MVSQKGIFVEKKFKKEDNDIKKIYRMLFSLKKDMETIKSELDLLKKEVLSNEKASCFFTEMRLDNLEENSQVFFKAIDFILLKMGIRN